jgi:hypothetical protein
VTLRADRHAVGQAPPGEDREAEEVRRPYERRYCNEHVLPFLVKEYAEVYPGLVIASATAASPTPS